jgi:hypothetical protein
VAIAAYTPPFTLPAKLPLWIIPEISQRLLIRLMLSQRVSD